MGIGERICAILNSHSKVVYPELINTYNLCTVYYVNYVDFSSRRVDFILLKPKHSVVVFFRKSLMLTYRRVVLDAYACNLNEVSSGLWWMSVQILKTGSLESTPELEKEQVFKREFDKFIPTWMACAPQKELNPFWFCSTFAFIQDFNVLFLLIELSYIYIKIYFLPSINL